MSANQIGRLSALIILFVTQPVGFYGNDYILFQHLTDRVSMYAHAYTLYSSVRPFGVSLILGSYDEADGAQMYMTDPSGVSWVSIGHSTELNIASWSSQQIKYICIQHNLVIYTF